MGAVDAGGTGTGGGALPVVPAPGTGGALIATAGTGTTRCVAPHPASARPSATVPTSSDAGGTAQKLTAEYADSLDSWCVDSTRRTVPLLERITSECVCTPAAV